MVAIAVVHCIYYSTTLEEKERKEKDFQPRAHTHESGLEAFKNAKCNYSIHLLYC